jgi:hypothetical protein
MVVHGIQHRGLSESLEIYEEAMDLDSQMRNLSNQIIDENGAVPQRAQAYRDLTSLANGGNYAELLAASSRAQYKLNQCCSLHTDYVKNQTLYLSSLNSTDGALQNGKHEKATLYDVVQILNGAESNDFSFGKDITSKNIHALATALGIDEKTLSNETKTKPDAIVGDGPQHAPNLEKASSFGKHHGPKNHDTNSGLNWHVNTITENYVKHLIPKTRKHHSIAVHGKIEAFGEGVKATGGNNNPALDDIRRFLQ